MALPTDPGSAEFLKAVLDALPGMAYVFDLTTGASSYVNRDRVDRNAAQAEGVWARIERAIHPDDLPVIRAHHGWLKTAKTDEPRTAEYRLRMPDGNYVWLSSNDRPFWRDAEGHVTHVVGYAQDLSKQKALEAARLESEGRFGAIVAALPDAVFIAGEHGRFLEVNDAACAQVGRSREELLAMHLPDLLAPEFKARAQVRLSSGQGATAAESVHLRKDGSRVPVETLVVPITLGQQRAMLGVVRDISERKSNEARLLREATLLEAIIENAVEGVCVCEDIDEPPGIRFSVWNRRMTEISGYTLEEINRLGWYQTVYTDPETRARAADRMARMRRGENLAAEEWNITRKDGASRTLLISTNVILSPGSPPKVLGVMHDVTDRLRLERQLQDAQRMEAIGRLAGAVAHDFNNILTAILGSAEMLKDLPRYSRGLPALAEDLSAAATRGADLTRQLLTFSRRQRTEKRPLDLGAQVELTLRMVGRLLDGAVQTEMSLAPGCFVNGDPAMLDQVVMNLALNARDAMPKGGTMKVAVASAGDQVTLTVSDSGEGIAAAALPHVFEPFFTTKDAGRGTGLGLATVYGVVTQHGGTITVDSALGRGTTFVVTLPRVAAVAHAAAVPAASGALSPLTVLLVEDQPLVRRTVRSMLEAQGHQVYDAGSTIEALAQFDKHGASLSLLLTDVSLERGDTGTALAELIKQRRGDLPIVFMSGFDAVLASLPLVEGYDFLQKPFTAPALNALLQRRLGR